MRQIKQWYVVLALLAISITLLSGCSASPVRMEVKDKEKPSENKTEYQISMNIEPVFQTGSAKGDVAISNVQENNCYLEVVYYLKDTKTEIYRTGIMPPGSQIATAALETNLKSGEYPVVVRTNVCDEKGQELTGSIDTDIIVTVQH